MRWSYILPRFTFLFLLWAFFYFAFDPLLKWGMIKGLQSALEAKVDIQKVKTGFLHPSFEVYGLRAGNSKEEFKNLFEFSSLKLKLDGRQLLEKKFIVQEASLSGLEFSTARKTSCKIKITKTETPEFVKKFSAQASHFAMDKISEKKEDFYKDINLQVSDLESAKLLKEIQDKYENEYKDALGKADFSKYQERMNAINEKYEKLKQQKNFLKQAKEFPALKKEADALFKDFKSDKDTVSKLVSDTSSLYSRLEEAKKKDVEKAMSMAKLPSLDKGKIADMLLGQETMDKIGKYWGMANTAMKYIPENPRKNIFQEKKKRGREIHFPKENNYPKFLAKRLHIDGILSPENPIAYSGSILNITNQPSVYRYPLTAKINGSKDSASISLNSLAYLYKDPVESETSVKYYGAEIGGMSLGADNSVRLTVKKAAADSTFNLKTVSNRIDGLFKSNFRNAQIDSSFASIGYQPLRASLEKSFAGITSFNLEIKLSGEWNKPDIKMDTDLAGIISEAFKKSFSEQLDTAKKQAQAKVDAAIKEQKDKLDKLLKDRKNQVDSKLKENQNKLETWEKETGEKLKTSVLKGLPKIKF